MSSPAPSPESKKGSRWKKWLIAAGTLASLGIGGYYALGKALENYLQSHDLRTSISQMTAEALDAPSGYLPLQWRAASVSSAGLLAQDNAGHSLTELRADDIQAHLDFSEIWKRKLLDQPFAGVGPKSRLQPLGVEPFNAQSASQAGAQRPRRGRSVF